MFPDFLSHDVKNTQTIVTFGLFFLLSLWETLAPFMLQYRRQELNLRAVHLGKNLVLGAINIVVGGLIFPAIWLAVGIWSRDNSFGLLHQLSLSVPLHALAVFLILDVWTYWWHRVNHEWSFLWRFHHVHHSDPKMDVTTAYRFHFGEMFMSHILRIFLIGAMGFELWQVLLYDMIMFTNVQIHHANIAVPMWLDKALRKVIVTPFMHKVHHSDNPKEFNSNYSAFFSVWDRIFGSYRRSENPHEINFGLPNFDRPEKQGLVALLRAPIDVYRKK